MSRAVFKTETKSEATPASSETRNVLISFISYDQDNFEYKKTDLSFMRSFLHAPKSRNDIWRPSVALAQLHGLNKEYDDLIFSDYYLLWDELDIHKRVMEEVEQDILSLPGHPALHIENPGITQPFDPKDVYRNLFKYLAQDKFHAPGTQYYVNCTNGTTQMRNCLFLLTQTGHIQALRIAPAPWDNHRQRDKKKDIAKGYTQDGHRTVKGCYTIDDPSDFNAAYASIGKSEDTGTLRILKKGVITKDTSRLKKIATIIDKIKAISIPEFRAKQTILITGETGVGKTHLAKNMAEALGLIDHGNNGETVKFIALNCATIRGADPNIQRIELFGATGTVGNAEKKDGALLKAKDGMLFLDEIGELSLEMQAMLLTALDEGYFIPLGGDPAKPERSTFQLVCGTNRPLEEFVEEGRFRRDLFNRINAWHLKLRPLREHREDIELNVKYLLSEVSRNCGANVVTFTPEAEKAFLEFSADEQITWDGNFRELNTMVTRMVILSDGLAITPDIVQDEIAAAREKYREAEKRKSARSNDAPARQSDWTPSGGACAAPQTRPQGPSTSPAHGRIIDFSEEAYSRLTKLEKAEFDLIDEAVNRDNITDEEGLCAAVYGGKRKKKSLYRRLGAIGLHLSRQRLTHVPPTRQTAS